MKYVIVFFTLNFVFFTFSTLVSLLPTKNIKKNVAISITEMESDGCYPFGIINKREFQMDNFTDAIVLSQNYSIDNKKPVLSALNATFAIRKGNPLLETKRQIDSEDDLKFTNYARYWHGNTFLIRPFLMFTDYSEIRWILYVVSSLLSLILGIKLFQTIGMRKTIAFFLGLLFVNVFITQFSIQFFTTVNLSIIACILICKHFNNPQKILLVSFIFGCLTSYFDLLTAPLLTCGLPLIIYISAQKEKSFVKRLSSLCLFAVLWGVGYALTWVSKWTVGTVFTDINVFKDALDTTLYRISSEDFSRFNAIIDNYKLLPALFIFMVLVVLTPLLVLFFNKKALKTNLLLLIVAAFPYIWFLVVAQHSWWHSWFTYRIQAISIISLFFIFINFISWDKIGIKK